MTENIMEELAIIQAAAAELAETLEGLAASHVLYSVLLQELTELEHHLAELKESTKNL